MVFVIFDNFFLDISYLIRYTIIKGGDDMTQGERVKQLRTALDLTLEKFGERVGVGKAAISKLEKNENRLSDQMIKSICREFNVNYDWLVYGEGEMFSELPKTILDELCRVYDLDEIDRKLIQEYIKMSKESRRVLKDYIMRIISDK